jgi:hypothetical protein
MVSGQEFRGESAGALGRGGRSMVEVHPAYPGGQLSFRPPSTWKCR